MGCSQSDLQGETDVAARHRPWHFLNFLPLPQGQGSLRPTFSDVRWTGALRTAGSSPRFSVIRTDRKSTRLNSSHGYISYAVFCLKKKKLRPRRTNLYSLHPE